MMNSASLNRLGNIKTMIDNIQDDLHGGIDNRFATGAADSEHWFAVLRHNCRRHTGKRAFFWGHQIWRGTNLSALISDTWHCIKVSQLIIQQISTAIYHDC